jgi:hypothetical protein
MINDFLTYADLLGWPTRGIKACPYCMYSTRSTWLKHGKKYCYMGYRRRLPMDHPLRKNRRTFDKKQELECAPEVSSGEILRQLEGMIFSDESAGKTPDPTELTKKDRKKKKKKQKKKRKKEKKRKTNEKN